MRTRRVIRIFEHPHWRPRGKLNARIRIVEWEPVGFTHPKAKREMYLTSFAMWAEHKVEA